MNNNTQFTLTELVDIMVALGHMEGQCKEWVEMHDYDTNRTNLSRVTELKQKVTDMLTDRTLSALELSGSKQRYS